MPEFDGIFRQAVSEINQMRNNDFEVQDALSRYNGRNITLVVNGDGVYVFYISSDGVSYELNPPSIPNDMYARMDIGRARKLVYTQNLGLPDIFAIEHRNIGLGDIQFLRFILGRKGR